MQQCIGQRQAREQPHLRACFWAAPGSWAALVAQRRWLAHGRSCGCGRCGRRAQREYPPACTHMHGWVTMAARGARAAARSNIHAGDFARALGCNAASTQPPRGASTCACWRWGHPAAQRLACAPCGQASVLQPPHCAAKVVSSTLRGPHQPPSSLPVPHTWRLACTSRSDASVLQPPHCAA